MPQGLSSSPLPAVAVLRAAGLALNALLEERQALRNTLIAEYRKAAGGWTWLKTDAAVWERMPLDRRAVYANYRVKDEHVICALRGLCDAAIRYNNQFTIVVTADDFRLLNAYYST